MSDPNGKILLRWIEAGGINYVSVADLDAWLERYADLFDRGELSGCSATIGAVRECLLRYIAQTQRDD